MVLKGAIIVLAFVAFIAFIMACVCISAVEDEEMENIIQNGNYACYTDEDDD